MIRLRKNKIFGGLMVILIAGFVWGLTSLNSETVAKKAAEAESPVMMVPASFSELGDLDKRRGTLAVRGGAGLDALAAKACGLKYDRRMGGRTVPCQHESTVIRLL